MTVFNQSCGGTLGLSGGVTKQANKKVAGVLGLLGGIQSGTAQAGASKSITLAPGAFEMSDAYAGGTVEITGGTGAGQVRNVVGSRKNLAANSVFAGTIGNKPTGWGTSGIQSLAAVIGTDQSSNPIVGHQQVSMRRIGASGYEGMQQNCLVVGSINTVRVFIRIPTGVTASSALLFGFGGPNRVIASAATLNAQIKDVWVQYTVSVTPTVSFCSFVISDGSIGHGFDICAPMPEVGQVASDYVATAASAAVGAIIDTPWDIIPDSTSTYIRRDGKNFRLIGKAVGGTLSFAGGLGSVLSRAIAKLTMLFKKRGMTFTFSQRTAAFTASKRSATFRKVP